MERAKEQSIESCPSQAESASTFEDSNLPPTFDLWFDLSELTEKLFQSIMQTQYLNPGLAYVVSRRICLYKPT